MPDTKIQITIEAVDKAKAALTDLANSLKAIGSEAKATGTASQGLGGILGSLKETWMGLSIGINQALEIFNKAIEIPRKMAAWGEMGAQIERTEQAFKAVADAAGVSSERLLKGLDKAARGMMDDTEILQRAGRLIQEGINPDKMIQLMDLLAKQAPVVGDTLPEAWDKFSMALSTGNVRAVRAYVGYVDLDHVLDRYAQSVGTVSRNLSEEARTAAILEVSLEKLRERTGGLTKEHTALWQSIEARKTEIKKTWEDIYKSFEPFALLFLKVSAEATKFIALFAKGFGEGGATLGQRLRAPTSEEAAEAERKAGWTATGTAGGRAAGPTVRPMTVEEQRQMESTLTASTLDEFAKKRRQAAADRDYYIQLWAGSAEGRKKADEWYKNESAKIDREITVAIIQENIKRLEAEGRPKEALLESLKLERVQIKDISLEADMANQQKARLDKYNADVKKEMNKAVLASTLDMLKKERAEIDIEHEENLEKWKEETDGKARADEIAENRREALSRKIRAFELEEQVKILEAKGKEEEATKLGYELEKLQIKDKSQLALVEVRQEFAFAKIKADKEKELKAKVTESILDDGERQLKQIDEITAEMEKKYAGVENAIFMIAEIRANAIEKLRRKTQASIKEEEAATLEAEGNKRKAAQVTKEKDLLQITEKNLVEATSRRHSAQMFKRDREAYLEEQKILIAAELDEFKRENAEIILRFIERKAALKEEVDGEKVATTEMMAARERLRVKMEALKTQEKIKTLEILGDERGALLANFDLEQLTAKSAIELDAIKARQAVQLEKFDFDQKMKYQKDFTQAQIDGWELYDRQMADRRMQIDGIQEKERAFLYWHKEYVSANLEIWGELFRRSSEFAKEYLSFRQRELDGDVEYLRKTVGDSIALERYRLEKMKALQIEAGTMPAKESFIEGLRLQAREWQNLSQQMVDMAKAAAQSMQQAFSDGFFNILTLQFNKLGDVLTNFLQGIARAISNVLSQQVSAPIIAGLQGWLGGAGAAAPAAGTAVLHAGSHGVIQLVPKLHLGLASDEFPAILQTGEQVLSRREVAAGMGSTQVIINVENRTGTPIRARETSVQNQGKKMVRTILLEMAESDMTVRAAFGLNR